MAALPPSPPRRASNPRPKSSQSPIPFACWQPARSRSILNLMNLWPVRSGPPPGKNLISNDFGLYADVGSVARGSKGRGGGRGVLLFSYYSSVILCLRYASLNDWCGFCRRRNRLRIFLYIVHRGMYMV